MKALFFGPVARQLFGAYHAPSEDRKARDTAVVLVNPWIAESNMTHRAFRRVALNLARAGFPTLRFDYYGTGDSMGTPEEHTVASALADVLQAIDEVRDRSGARRVSLVGLRLGAALAIEASERASIQDLVLWEPVLRGDAYLDELYGLDKLQRLWRLSRDPARGHQRSELLGYSFPAAVREEIARLDVAGRTPSVAGRVHVITREANGAYTRFTDALQARGLRAALQIVPEEAESAPPAVGVSALLAAKAVAAISSSLESGESR